MQSLAQRQAPLQPYRVIEFLDIAAGQGSILATLTLRLGGLTIHNITVRRGRGDTTYINMPRSWQHGHWQPVVEFHSDRLREFVEHEVLKAVAETLR